MDKVYKDIASSNVQWHNLWKMVSKPLKYKQKLLFLLSFSCIPHTVTVAIILGAQNTFWPRLLIFLLVTTSWFVKSLNGKWCPFDIVNLFHPFLPSVDGILFSTYASYTTCMYLHFSLSLVSLNSLFLYFMTPFLNWCVLISKFLFIHFRKS